MPELEELPQSPKEEVRVESQRSDHRIYTGCDTTKSCYGLPPGCVADGDCDMLATWVLGYNTSLIELYSRPGSGRYVGLGFSHDEKMGSDLVFLCIDNGGVPSLQHSWNVERGKSSVVMVGLEGSELLEGSMEDGQELYCKLERNNWVIGYPPTAGASQFLYQLDKEQYHLLLAGGVLTKESDFKLSYHGAGFAQATMDSVDMARVGPVVAYYNILLKAHGILMIAAWLGCAGSGIVLARYFKDTWRDSSCCGQDQWFAWHRLLMTLVWVTTIAGIVCIFLDVKGWPYSKEDIMTNPHPVLGVAAALLTFIQPFLALCRPAPTSSARWIFNWTHWFVGNSAHVIGKVFQINSLIM